MKATVSGRAAISMGNKLLACSQDHAGDVPSSRKSFSFSGSSFLHEVSTSGRRRGASLDSSCASLGSFDKNYYPPFPSLHEQAGLAVDLSPAKYESQNFKNAGSHPSSLLSAPCASVLSVAPSLHAEVVPPSTPSTPLSPSPSPLSWFEGESFLSPLTVEGASPSSSSSSPSSSSFASKNLASLPSPPSPPAYLSALPSSEASGHSPLAPPLPLSNPRSVAIGGGWRLDVDAFSGRRFFRSEDGTGDVFWVDGGGDDRDRAKGCGVTTNQATPEVFKERDQRNTISAAGPINKENERERERVVTSNKGLMLKGEQYAAKSSAGRGPLSLRTETI